MAWAKEATVIILDIGSHMDEPVEEGAKLTALQASIQSVTRMLQNKLFTESKDEFALVLLGEETDNRLNEEVADESYLNIKTESNLKLIDWTILDSIAKIKHTTNIHGDVFEGLKVAVDIIEHEEGASKRKRFGKHRIVLFTNLHGPLEAGVSEIAGFAKNAESADINGIQLIGVDLEEAQQPDSLHSKRTKKAKVRPVSFFVALFQGLEKVASEKTLETLESYSFRDIMRYTNYFTNRQLRPTPWNGVLELGNSLKVPVVMYARVKEAKPKQTWKKAYAANPTAAINQSTQYFVQRGLQRDEVPSEEIVEAYRYGTTLVPFSDEDKQEMKFTGTGKCLKVLGFAMAAHVKGHLYTGDDVKILTGPMTDEAALTAVSALAHALHEEKMVVICKYGSTAVSAPKMVCLSPHLCSREAGPYEGFFVHFLPFEDDLRLYTFANLMDAKSKPLFQPNDEQLQAVGDLIDQLTVTPDDDYFNELNPKNVRNPHLQRLYQSLQHRALHPDQPLPPLDASLLTKLSMPVELEKRSEETRDKIKLLFPLKVMEKKKFVKGFGANGTADGAATSNGDAQVDGMAGLSIGEVEEKVTAIGTIRPMEDFIALTSEANDTRFGEIVQEAIGVINRLIFSFDGEVYADKILRLISMMREQSAARHLPATFNLFLKGFKTDLLDKKMNAVWNRLVDDKLTLIHHNETKESAVTKTEAEEFLTAAKVAPVVAKKAAPKKDDDDMFEEMFG